MVVAAGSPASPNVLVRRRIEIADRKTPGSVQPYHYAAELDLPGAKAHLVRCAAQSRNLAQTAVEDALQRYKVIACAILMSSARPMGTLEATLASHAAIHSAEGDFFRDAILHAAEACAIPCKKIKEKDLLAAAHAAFGIDPEPALAEMRKALGPPWTQDEKYAALAAWLALQS